jgi:His/Glu/Gln/Arg/opine family amino acid ABC transporter permease subunit
MFTFIVKLVKMLQKYYMLFVTGTWNTLWISAVTVLLGTLLGMVIALMRMGKIKPFRLFTDVYIEILRGTPVLLQLYFFWIFLPKFPPLEGLTDLQCILIALIINASAYIAEIIRAGIGAVDKGQWEAAKSIGLSSTHTMTYVILPQAVKNILPALCNEFISTVKGTSLASVFFVGELMTQYKTVASITYLPLQPLVVAGIIYFVLNFILSRSVRVLERRLMVSD